MENLIKNTIRFYGAGNPDLKTIFTIEKDFEKTFPRYRNLSHFSGRKLTIQFDTEDDDEVITQHSIKMLIIESGDEIEIKAFILGEITKYLNDNI